MNTASQRIIKHTDISLIKTCLFGKQHMGGSGLTFQQ